jgi:PAS domain S-box-containing protein
MKKDKRKADRQRRHRATASKASESRREQADTALRESEKKFRTLSETTAASIFIYQGSRFCYGNSASEVITGYTREELATMNFWEIVHPDFRELVKNRATARQRGEQPPSRYEIKIITKSGKERWLDLSVSLIDFRGKPAGLCTAFDITARKRAEKALQDSEERYRNLVDNSLGLICTHDLNGTLLSVNPAAADTLGYQPSDMVGHNLRGFLAAPVRHSFDDYLERIRRETADSGLLRMVTRGGEERIWIYRNVRHEEEGKPLYVLGHAMDITEQKQAEKALRFAQFAIDHASDPAFWIKPDGRFFYVNDAACQALGYTREELLSMTVPDIDPDYPQETWADHWQEMKQEGSHIFEAHHRTKDGRVFPVEITTNHLDYSGHEFNCAFARDITERRRAEAERNRLLAAIEQSAEGVAITDSEGSIEYINPAFTAITGYGREEALGQNPRFLKSGQHDDKFYAHLWRTLKAGHTWQGEIINRRKDGSFYPEWMTITPVRDPDGKVAHFIAIKDDITERKRLEEQLGQSQRMEAIGRLASGVAHDFNNMLGVIVGYSDLVLQGVSPTDPLRKKVEEIQKASERARNLTGQLLAFSRRQILEPQVLDLRVLVADMKPMLCRLIGEHIELTLLSAAAEIGRVKVDQGQMEQILLNLVVNARDAMPQGGLVRVETKNVEIDEQFARQHPGARPGAYVMLAVSDTGSGIDEETKAHIFEPFYTTKEKGKGTGLGLATVYGIVKQSAGYICVESELGRGSTFAVYLPQVEEPLPEPEQVKPPQAHKGGRETILLVEDEALLRTMVSDFLGGSGYQVLEAANGIEAIRIAEEHTDPIHLLLTDVVMPGINGQVLAERLTADRPETKVLFMSGYIDDAVVRREMLDPDMQFLQKPFTLPVLASRVRDMLESEGQKDNPDRGGSRGRV